MLIVHVIEATGGGALAMLRLLVNAQAAKGHQVFVLYSIRPDTPADLELQFSDTIRLINVDMGNIFRKLIAIYILRKKIMEIGAQIVFLHSSFAGFLGRLALLFNRTVKIFYIPHGISFLRKDVSEIQRSVFVFLERLASFRKAVFVACSHSEKDAVLYYLPDTKCYVVENAIQGKAADKKRRVTTGQTGAVVVTVARLTPAKRPEWFAEIANKVVEYCPHIKFIWIGDGDDVYKAKLAQAGVVITGWLTPEEVMKWLSQASIYVSTSHWEGMPIALIEAQLAGVPVVASHCSGNVDIIEHGTTGWLYQSPEEAANRIMAILRDMEQANKVADVAKERAKSRFCSERYLSDIDNLISSP